MHTWGDEGVDWDGISDAARWIADNLIRWGRISVYDYKEKWGTVRVYCGYMISLHSLLHPRHPYKHPRWPQWLWTLDCLYLSRILPRLLGPVLFPWQRFVYRSVYRAAIRKWPHLKKEILACADFRELLQKEIAEAFPESAEERE